MYRSIKRVTPRFSLQFR